MKNLGKIIGILFLLSTVSFGAVVASLDYPQASKGDMLTYTLKITDSSDVVRPRIHSICGSDVLSTSSATNLEIVNSKYSRSYLLKYRFIAKKSCEIKPVKISTGEGVQTSNSVSLELDKVVQSKNPNFVLTLKTDKKELYVGEPFKLILLFKQKKSAQAVDSKFKPPSFNGLWVKHEDKPQTVDDGAYTLTKLTYVLAAQREGNLTIEPAQMSIASRAKNRDYWGSFRPQVRWKSYFSNEVKLTAKPLPNGAKLIGDFTISAQLDKSEVNANEAINVTIEIRGNGNFEDISAYKPYINGVSVFDEKPIVKANTFTQKLAMVADEDFTVAPFKLHFYDPVTKQVREIRTEALKVKVHGSQKKQELTIEREQVETPEVLHTKDEVPKDGSVSLLFAAQIFVVGLILGALLVLLLSKKRFKREKPFNYKDEKQLLIKLLPYKDDKDVQKVIDAIEGNLYSSSKVELDKKLIKELVKRYNLV